MDVAIDRIGRHAGQQSRRRGKDFGPAKVLRPEYRLAQIPDLSEVPLRRVSLNLLQPAGGNARLKILPGAGKHLLPPAQLGLQKGWLQDGGKRPAVVARYLDDNFVALRPGKAVHGKHVHACVAARRPRRAKAGKAPVDKHPVKYGRSQPELGPLQPAHLGTEYGLAVELLALPGRKYRSGFEKHRYPLLFFFCSFFCLCYGTYCKRKFPRCQDIPPNT